MPRTSAHSRTNKAGSRLAAALAISLALHLLPLMPPFIFAVNQPSTAKMPALRAELRPPPAVQATPELKLSAEESLPAAPKKPAEAIKKAPEKTPGKSANWTQVVKQHLHKLESAGLFYPLEAIARGQQGTVDVLIMLDEGGNVVAARVEQSSGHVLLDDAALRAVRSLSALPADAPRQVVLPVRFRLH